MRNCIWNRLKRNIAIALLLFLTATCCVGFDVSLDAGSFGGGISGSDFSSIDHSMIALAHTGLRGGSNQDENHEESLTKTVPNSDYFSRVFRKLLLLSGIGGLTGVAIQFTHYYLTLCIACCAYLFYLTLVRTTHLKDGAK